MPQRRNFHRFGAGFRCAVLIAEQLVANRAGPVFFVAIFGAGRSLRLCLLQRMPQRRNFHRFGAGFRCAVLIAEQLVANRAGPVFVVAVLRAGRCHSSDFLQLMLAVAVLQRILSHITTIGHTVVPMIPRITRPLLTPVVLMIRSRYFIQCNSLFGRSPVKRCPYEEIALLGFTRDGDQPLMDTHAAGGVTTNSPSSGFRHIGSNSAIVSGSSCFHCNNLSDGGYIHFFLADSDPKVTALQCNILQFRIRILLSPCHGPDLRKVKTGECAFLLHSCFCALDRASSSSIAYANAASFLAVKTGRHVSTIIVLSQNAAVVIKRSIHRSHIIAGSDDTSVFSKADNAALVKS